MAEVICNTSPLQYLHQLRLLHILPALTTRVIIPPAVVDELAAGRGFGVDVPDPELYTWITVRRPVAAQALPLVNDLGPGETQVLMLGLELPDSVVVIDDALGRRIATALALRLTGTLGILVDAKRTGLVPAIAPLLDQLDALRFRLGAETRAAVLKIAGEEPSR